MVEEAIDGAEGDILCLISWSTHRAVRVWMVRGLAEPPWCLKKLTLTLGGSKRRMSASLVWTHSRSRSGYPAEQDWPCRWMGLWSCFPCAGMCWDGSDRRFDGYRWTSHSFFIVKWPIRCYFTRLSMCRRTTSSKLNEGIFIAGKWALTMKQLAFSTWRELNFGRWRRCRSTTLMQAASPDTSCYCACCWCSRQLMPRYDSSHLKPSITPITSSFLFFWASILTPPDASFGTHPSRTPPSPGSPSGPTASAMKAGDGSWWLEVSIWRSVFTGPFRRAARLISPKWSGIRMTLLRFNSRNRVCHTNQGNGYSWTCLPSPVRNGTLSPSHHARSTPTSQFMSDRWVIGHARWAMLLERGRLRQRNTTPSIPTACMRLPIRTGKSCLRSASTAHTGPPRKMCSTMRSRCSSARESGWPHGHPSSKTSITSEPVRTLPAAYAG